MSRLLKWGAYVAVLAVAFYFVMLAGVPYGVMSMIKTRMASVGGGTANVMIHAERPSHTSRNVVRPSPELLYSICWYDLSKGPVRVTSGAPQGTYWSVALYRDNTDNFYVVNDTQTKGARAAFILYSEAQVQSGGKAAFEAFQGNQGVPGVASPSMTGLVLIRTLINDESKLPEIDGERRQATCTAVVP
jgi:uncharacterized membrane protein